MTKISGECSKMRETEVVNMICDVFSKADYTSLIKVSRSGVVYRSSYWEAVKIKGVKVPKPLVLPDFILVFKDYQEYIDEYLIVAVETKWFKGKGKNLDKRLRKAYREFGQPIRNYIFGFDSTLLLHLFHEDVGESRIISYVDNIDSAIKLLDLPIVYMATKLINNKFHIYSPVSIERLQDTSYVINYIHNLCSSVRNPILEKTDEKERVIERRKVLKTALNLP